jgi:hypothetical protein
MSIPTKHTGIITRHHITTRTTWGHLSRNGFGQESAHVTSMFQTLSHADTFRHALPEQTMRVAFYHSSADEVLINRWPPKAPIHISLPQEFTSPSCFYFAA